MGWAAGAGKGEPFTQLGVTVQTTTLTFVYTGMAMEGLVDNPQNSTEVRRDTHIPTHVPLSWLLGLLSQKMPGLSI